MATVIIESRRAILAATTMKWRWVMQRANGVIHLIVGNVADLSSNLKLISGHYMAFRLPPVRRRNEAGHKRRRQPRAEAAQRDMTSPTCTSTLLKMKARNFR